MAKQTQVDQDQILVAHEATYNAFKALIRWCIVGFGSSTLMLTIWFATPAGFFPALIIGVLVFAFGYFFVVRDKARQPLDV